MIFTIKRVAKCSSCGTEVRFTSSAANALQTNINETIQWEKRAEEAMKIMESAKKLMDEAKRNYDNGKQKFDESKNGLQKLVSKLDTLLKTIINTAEIVPKKK